MLGLPSLYRRKSFNCSADPHITVVEELTAYYDAVAQFLKSCIRIEVSWAVDNDLEEVAVHLHSISRHCRLHFWHSSVNIVAIS